MLALVQTAFADEDVQKYSAALGSTQTDKYSAVLSGIQHIYEGYCDHFEARFNATTSLDELKDVDWR